MQLGLLTGDLIDERQAFEWGLAANVLSESHVAIPSVVAAAVTVNAAWQGQSSVQPRPF